MNSCENGVTVSRDSSIWTNVFDVEWAVRSVRIHVLNELFVNLFPSRIGINIRDVFEKGDEAQNEEEKANLVIILIRMAPPSIADGDLLN